LEIAAEQISGPLSEFIKEFVKSRFPAASGDPAMTALVAGLVIGCILTWFIYWLVHRGRIYGLVGERDILKVDNDSLKNQVNDLKETLAVIKDQAREPLQPITNAGVNPQGRIEIYNSREEYPLPTEELHKAGAIWCLFQNASQLRHTEFFQKYMVERLILYSPFSELLTFYETEYQTAKQIKDDIYNLGIQLEKLNKFSIRYYDGPYINSMFICNPKSGNGFV
jgi:hypothetical protein